MTNSIFYIFPIATAAQESIEIQSVKLLKGHGSEIEDGYNFEDIVHDLRRPSAYGPDAKFALVEMDEDYNPIHITDTLQTRSESLLLIQWAFFI